MIGQQGSLGVSPAELLAAKNMASGKSNMNKEISLGGDLTRLMLAAMQLKKSQAELEKVKLTRGANPQTTVAQDVQKGIAQLQGQPEEQPQGQPQGQPQQMARLDSGIGGLPAGAIDNEDAFAGGGIVAFAEGDQVKSKPPTYSLTDDQKAYLAETDKIVGLPPGTSLRQIEVESAFNPRAVSPANAKGLAQIYPPTLPGASRLVGRKLDPFNPTDSLEGHRALMTENMGRYKDPVKALRAYNGGWTESKWDTSKENREYAPKILGFLTGSGNANAAPPAGIKATLTPSELQAKSDNEALKAAGSGIKGFADSGVAALKDWATVIPRAASRAYGAVTGNEPPMTTNSWTPYSDADSAQKEDATKDGAPKGHPQSHERGKDEGDDLPSVVTIPAKQRVQPQEITSDREPDGSKYSPNGRTAPAIKSLKDIANDTLYKGLTTELLSREAYDKQVNAIAKKEGTDPASMKEFFDKQSASFTNQAVEAKKNRDVDLWMSAAQGFFAMGAGTSPRALQNFAMGAGIGVKQAQSALNEYGKAQKEINAAQRDIAKFEMSHRETRTTQQIASYDKALARADLFEARKLGIAEKVWERIIRQDEIKLQKGQLRESQIQRLELERGRLLELAERNWLTHQEKNALDVMQAKDMTKPKDAAAAQARLDKDYKRIFSHVPPSVAGADRQAITRSPEDQALLAKYGG